jgi:hypothetical protein
VVTAGIVANRQGNSVLHCRQLETDTRRSTVAHSKDSIIHSLSLSLALYLFLPISVTPPPPLPHPGHVRCCRAEVALPVRTPPSCVTGQGNSSVVCRSLVGHPSSSFSLCPSATVRVRATQSHTPSSPLDASCSALVTVRAFGTVRSWVARSKMSLRTIRFRCSRSLHHIQNLRSRKKSLLSPFHRH